MSEVQAILEGTFSGVNLLIIGRLSKADAGIGVCVMPGRIEVVSGGFDLRPELLEALVAGQKRHTPHKDPLETNNKPVYQIINLFNHALS